MSTSVKTWSRKAILSVPTIAIVFLWLLFVTNKILDGQREQLVHGVQQVELEAGLVRYDSLLEARINDCEAGFARVGFLMDSLWNRQDFTDE